MSAAGALGVGWLTGAGWLSGLGLAAQAARTAISGLARRMVVRTRMPYDLVAARATALAMTRHCQPAQQARKVDGHGDSGPVVRQAAARPAREPEASARARRHRPRARGALPGHARAARRRGAASA